MIILKAVVVFSHPNPDSFNGAILDVIGGELAARGVEVTVKDLYGMQWDPRLTVSDLEKIHNGQLPDDIAQEQADISAADLMVFIGPVWWFSVPAILKGYLDRVFSHGFAYNYTPQGPQGLLQGKKALLITTSGADEESDSQTGMTDILRKSLVDGVFVFSGFDEARYKNYYAVPTVSDEARKLMLEDVKTLLAGII